jgi:hypothetical protein
MDFDLNELLNDWNYDPENATRIVKLPGGRSVIQVRLPLGVEQYEMDGRPDGVRPFGSDNYLEIVKQRRITHISDRGSDEGFEIGHEDLLSLQNEGLLYYYRYLLLFQLRDFERVIRDTEHNLELSDLTQKYCSDDEDRAAIFQYKPYILRMNAISKVMKNLEEVPQTDSLGVLQGAIDEINNLPEIDSPTFQFERVRSVNYLKSALRQIENSNPDPVEELKKELDLAVEEENYERAAEIRDKMRDLASNNPTSV